MKRFSKLNGIVFVAYFFIHFTVSGQASDSVFSLNECVQFALEKNITIKTSELTLEGAQNTLHQSKQERLPNLSGSGSQNFTNGNSIDPITSDFVSQRIHSTSLGLNTSMVLYNGNRINNQIKRNQLEIDQNEFLLEESKNNITFQVLEAYVQTAYAKESVVIAQNNYEKLKVQLSQTEAFYKVNVVTIKDLSEVQSQLSSAEFDKISAVVNFEQQLSKLKQLLEIPPGVQFNITGIDDLLNDSFEVPELMVIYQNAMEQLPELKAQKLELQLSEIDLAIARTGYSPTLSLNGSLGTGYTNTQNYSFGNQLDANFYQRVGLTLQIPIYDRGVTKLNVVNAKLSNENAALKQQVAEKTIYQKIESIWLNAKASEEQRKAALASLNASKVALDYSEMNFTKGNSSAYDVLIARTNYLNSEQNFLQINYLAFLYQKQLKFYQTGQL